jgi:hypothetical protein
LPPPNLIQFPNPSLRFQTQVIAIRSVLFFSFSSHARTWCFLDHSEFSSGMSVYVTPFRRTCIVPSLSGLRSGTPQKQRDNMKIQRWCCCYTCLSRSSKLIGGLLIAKSRRAETVRTAVLFVRRYSCGAGMEIQQHQGRLLPRLVPHPVCLLRDGVLEENVESIEAQWHPGLDL